MAEKNRYRINWSSHKVKMILSSFELGEGRMDKNHFMEVATKDIYYQMKHNGYIKNNGNNIVVTTKLRNHIKKHYSSSISSSNSIEHSRQCMDVISLFPKSILINHSFETQSVLEKRFRREIKNNSNCKQRINEMKEAYKSKLDSLGGADDIATIREKEFYESHISMLEQNQFHVSDMKLFFTYEEIEELKNNIQLRIDELKNCDDRYHLNEIERYSNFGKQIENVILQSENANDSQMIEVCIEVCTSNYHEREIFQHEAYAYITNQNIIYY